MISRILVPTDGSTTACKAAFLGSVSFGVIHKDTKIPVLVVRK
jgi:hypothetical protein